MVNKETYKQLSNYCTEKKVTLVAVSKLKSAADILEMYELGQRDFGENYVQELLEKQPQLPADIRWHFIGHLQSNKVKYIAPFVHLIHGVDSVSLLKEIHKQGKKNNRTIDCLLQLFIAREESKFGMDETELQAALELLPTLDHVQVKGLMGMASNTDDEKLVQQEFLQLKSVFDKNSKQTTNQQFETISMGMSGDYQLAVDSGSNMIRVGSLLFGRR